MCYRGASSIGARLKLDDHTLAELLVVAPKVLQALFAAATDFYTWRLSSFIYGRHSPQAAAATLVLTIVSPWHWFCSTRTFANSLETTLTVVALYNWPWHWALPLANTVEKARDQLDNHNNVRVRDGQDSTPTKTDEATRLRRALLCAAVATILRPTNILVWATLTALTFFRSYNTLGPSKAECGVFVRETVLCGSAVLSLSVLVDRIFYDSWVFPPLNFLHVNVVQSVATFYGNNDWHYYVSQGYPLLLTTALPFTLVGLFRILGSRITVSDAPPAGRNALRLLSIVCLVVPAAFSNIAHKEVHFIYPLLPALHVMTALPLASFFGSSTGSGSGSASTRLLPKKLLLFVLLLLNVSISYYVTRVHNSGIINLSHYLRHEFGDAYAVGVPHSSNMSVGMLMPCHSTPWRSHLQYPASSTHAGIRGWALTCEPPLDLDVTAKETYLDEADQFYANPSMWLKKNMSRRPPQRRQRDGSTRATAGVVASDKRSKRALIDVVDEQDGDAEKEEQRFWSTHQGRRPWPDYLVFFQHLEPTLQFTLRGSGYLECRRFFNSHWHDDPRRTGDVVVWCLDESRSRDAEPPTPKEEVERPIHDEPAVAVGDESDWPADLRIEQHEGSSPRMAESESATPHPPPSASHDATSQSKYKTKRSPVTRVVEKPFWKVREPED